jgi:hypothetical protein
VLSFFQRFACFSQGKAEAFNSSLVVVCLQSFRHSVREQSENARAGSQDPHLRAVRKHDHLGLPAIASSHLFSSCPQKHHEKKTIQMQKMMNDERS